MDKTRIIIMGCAGRMGQALLRCSTRIDNISVVGGVETAEHPAVGKDMGPVAGLESLGVTIASDLESVIGECDAVVDFTSPAVSVGVAKLAGARGKSAVIGTTGLAADDTASIKSAAEHASMVLAPNMSLGVNLLFALVQRAAGILQGYDIEITEKHHRHKKDAPSGTAIRLAEKAAEGAGLSLEKAAVYGRQGISGERPADQIGIHAVRAGDIVGEHTVLFATEGERMELSHAASGRECFAMGALRAAVWVKTQAPGLYDMQDMLGLKSKS